MTPASFFALPRLPSLMRISALSLAIFSLSATGCQQNQKPKSDKQAPATLTPEHPNEAQKSETNTAENPANTAEPDLAAKQDSETKRIYVVAALGDSITDDRVGGGGYLRELQKRCPKSRFVNFGKGGDMTNQMRRRFERDIRPQVKAEEFTTLLVFGGVNDLYSNLTAGRTNDVIEEDLGRIYAEARGLGLEIVAVTVSPWGGFTRYFNPERSQNTLLLNSFILGQVSKGNVDKAIDSYPLLSCGSPEVLCKEYESPSHDGLHPGQKGHELLGEKLYLEAFSDCL